MKTIILVFFTLMCMSAFCQTMVPSSSFNSSGGAMSPTYVPGTNYPTQMGAIGQQLVFARPVVTSNGGGFMVSNNVMFTSSTVDLIAPVISATTSLTLIKNTLGTLNHVITDNYPDALSAKLYYRPISGGTDGLFDSVAMEKNSTLFSVDITTDYYPNGYDDMGMEYYIKATDGSKRTTSGRFYEYLQHPAAEVPLTSFGDDVANYRIISVPFTIANNDFDDLFLDDLGAADKFKYRFFTYDGAFEEYPGFTEIERGKGYFIIVANDGPDLDLGTQTAPSNNRTEANKLYPMQLVEGWNLIGNPYPVAINWGNVKTFNGFSREARTYNGAGYSTGANQTIQPYQGAFVYSDNNTTITIPFLGQNSTGGKVAEQVFVFNEELSAQAWKVDLRIEQGDIVNQLNGVGMHPDAQLKVDNFDDFHPPHLSQFAELRFPHPEHKLGSFARDIVPTSESHVWRFNAETSSLEQSIIHWDNSQFGDNDKELYLYDVRTNAIVNMREEDHYSFSTAQSKEFKLYYGKDIRNRIGPDAVTVDEPYPNPFSLKEQVKFVVGLPDNLVTDYPVELVIRNSMGQPIYRSVQSLTPGLHTLAWNGRKSDNDVPASGFYLYTVKVGALSFTGKVLFNSKND